MDYELAKELKDAGFPQGQNNIYGTVEVYNLRAGSNCGRNFSDSCDDECRKRHVYFPTLSELIEACGDKFYSLVYAMENDWRCFSERDGDYMDTADGKTPEEAVARLWLALNKPKIQEA